MLWFWMRIVLAVLLTWVIISVCVSLLVGPWLARAGQRYGAVMNFYEVRKNSEEDRRADHR